MNRNLMISALRQGQNGDQILAILDAITSGSDVQQPADVDGFVHMPTIAQNVPTLEEIAF